ETVSSDDVSFFPVRIFIASPRVCARQGGRSAGQEVEKMLYLMREGQVWRQFRIMLGPRARGHKLQEGDERTPEGKYILDRKNPNSGFYKSIRVSYPSAVDIQRAHKYNVDPGDNIMIHGMKNGWSEKTMLRAEK